MRAVKCPQCNKTYETKWNSQKFCSSVCRDASYICEHKRTKSFCKDCKGSRICDHGKQKRTCKDCVGSGICKHGNILQYCKDCVGSGLCKHLRNKRLCKDCGGSCLCIHKVSKYECWRCDGSRICTHKRRKKVCPICAPEGAYKVYARNALRTSRSFDITLDQFKKIVELPCLYCKEDEDARGIDRWDNNLGYVFGNCRPCCRECNLMKGRMSAEDFIRHLRKIVSRNPKV
jgi:hypothetical protein